MNTARIVISAIVCASVLLVVCPTAWADYMTYEGVGPYRTTVRIHAPSVNRSVTAGQLRVEYQGTDYLTYCIDIYHNAGSGNVDQLSYDAIPNGDLVAFLFETYGGSVNSHIAAGALQVAIWELVNETAGNPWNAMTGAFYITDNASAASAANVLLSTMPGSYNPAYVNYVLDSESKQDMFIHTDQPLGAVPEPVTMALLSLGGVGLMLRRRKTI